MQSIRIFASKEKEEKKKSKQARKKETESQKIEQCYIDFLISFSSGFYNPENPVFNWSPVEIPAGCSVLTWLANTVGILPPVSATYDLDLHDPHSHHFLELWLGFLVFLIFVFVF
jgi:hypothetical protein